MANNVFSVEANGSKIIVCGREVPVAGAITKAALDKAAKDNGIRNYVVKNNAGNDLFVEDFPYTGVVKIVEYNAAKANGVFSVDAAAPASTSQILVCGRTIPVNGPIKKADLDKAAKDNGIRNYVVKDNEDGQDLFVEDFPFEGTVKIVEYNAAKRDGVFSVDAAAPATSKIQVCGREIPVAGQITKAILDKAAKDNGIRNYVVKNASGSDLFVEDFPYTGTVKIVEYNAAKIVG
jgi:hypothetical protein